MENGKIIRWTDRGFLLGRMEGFMLEGMWMIRNKDMECLLGLMGGSMKGNGLMGSSMGLGFILILN